MIVPPLIPGAQPEAVERPGQHSNAHYIGVVELGVLAEPSSYKTPDGLHCRISTEAGLLRRHSSYASEDSNLVEECGPGASGQVWQCRVCNSSRRCWGSGRAFSLNNKSKTQRWRLQVRWKRSKKSENLTSLHSRSLTPSKYQTQPFIPTLKFKTLLMTLFRNLFSQSRKSSAIRRFQSNLENLTTLRNQPLS